MTGRKDSRGSRTAPGGPKRPMMTCCRLCIVRGTSVDLLRALAERAARIGSGLRTSIGRGPSPEAVQVGAV
jgi:hypothetical protein